MKKPRAVMFYPHQVKSFDALGEEIPELSGPYTDQLREAIKAASDDRTVEQDVTSEWIRERYRTVIENALSERWKAQLEDTVGGWCCTVESVPGTPADGNPPILDFATEEVARHVAALHNDWLDPAVERCDECGADAEGVSADHEEHCSLYPEDGEPGDVAVSVDNAGKAGQSEG